MDPGGGKTSVIKARQDAGIAEGLAPTMTAVASGPHAKDRFACLRVAEFLLGICGKNPAACAAFKQAGMVSSQPPCSPPESPESPEP
jgi:hypothetical protein